MNFIQSIVATVIKYLYGILGNWGLAIIGVTLLIKIILFPLTLKQDKSMKGMKKIQPEVDKIREKYKDNPQELNVKVMELYKEHKVNPLGGCLPVVLQLPILWGLFGVLRKTGADALIPANTHFLIWNLTANDPTYILPILNGIVAFLQQKVMGQGGTGNKQMQMMTYTMPIFMVFISMSMPSGLQIYWVTSSLISFLQQYYIMKKE
ncbi:YidC/Oxa1 family membrane protein insertase [Haliovirga abyssi]|uniref:Membrane protein insertase YidC n=1 Tax=Haliovirga abyssi TaxID=2996794 RepID=A0AAU9DG98_9FUSO|nr:YidC/Oxa1 family membrane protein insertase [Haliovirga abyssi]BDU51497.1 membrane protein insertase YidC [Haliovirga abyssi]